MCSVELVKGMIPVVRTCRTTRSGFFLSCFRQHAGVHSLLSNSGNLSGTVFYFGSGRSAESQVSVLRWLTPYVSGAPNSGSRKHGGLEVWCGGSTEALDGHSSPHGMLCACNTPDRFIPVITSDIQGPKAFVVPRTTRFQSLPEVRLHFLLSIWPIPIVESDSSPPALDTLFYRPFSHENRAGIGSEAAQTPFPFLASFATPLVRLSLAYGVSDPRRKKRFSR